MNDYKLFRAGAHIDLDAIRSNLINISQRLPKGATPVAVVKAQAYGHGAVSVSKEIEDLVSRGFLKPDQGKLVDCEGIAVFFATDIGKRLRQGTDHIREFKFSILDDGSHYGEGLENERVLLQGVVDCAILEEDGITVLDFKTDFVTEDTVDGRAEYYRPQVLAYAESLSRIYERPVKANYLYFFRLNRFVKV